MFRECLTMFRLQLDYLWIDNSSRPKTFNNEMSEIHRNENINIFVKIRDIFELTRQFLRCTITKKE